jgi:glycosyltransferase involved in cell wall biosynthesis
MADLFLYASNLDSLPRVLLEAQAVGLPTIVNDFEAFREVVIHGHNGLLYKSGDFEDFRQKLDMLVTDPDLRYSLGQNALSHLKRNYSVEAVGNRLKEALQRVRLPA